MIGNKIKYLFSSKYNFKKTYFNNILLVKHEITSLSELPKYTLKTKLSKKENYDFLLP